MPSKPGEYCMRCGLKCTVVEEDGKSSYVCPNGHGVQGTYDASEMKKEDSPVPDTGTDVVSDHIHKTHEETEEEEQTEEHRSKRRR